MVEAAFVYTTYIRTAPDDLWRALTESAISIRYFGGGPQSDWRIGSPVRWWSPLENGYVDMDQVVLAAEPGRRLSYTWHNYQRMHMQMFGWTEEEFRASRQEPRGQVTFDLAPAGEAVKLVVRHEGLAPGGAMLKAMSWGWPIILSNLKSLLETGQTMAIDEAPTAQPAAPA